MDDRPKRGLWVILVPLFLAAVWADYLVSLGVAALAPAWAAVWIGLSQLTIAAGIATIDLYVIYWVVGLGRHATGIGSWMDRAFSGAGLRWFTKCPHCGFEASASPPDTPSNAERLLRERERNP